MHYTVGVITKTNPEIDMDELEKLMAPYSEHITVAPYIGETKQQIIDRGRSRRDQLREKYPDGIKDNEYLEKLYNAETDEELYEALHYDDAEYDEDGNYLTTYNPNSKWDWYVIGGRWSDELFHNSNTIQLKDYPRPEDLSNDEEELKEKYPREYEYYKELLENGDLLTSGAYFQEKYPSFRDYLARQITVQTYAVLDEKGIWHEPGQMGWFQSLGTPKDEREFEHAFYEKFIKSKDPELYFTVVDCHI